MMIILWMSLGNSESRAMSSAQARANTEMVPMLVPRKLWSRVERRWFSLAVKAPLSLAQTLFLMQPVGLFAMPFDSRGNIGVEAL